MRCFHTKKFQLQVIHFFFFFFCFFSTKTLNFWTRQNFKQLLQKLNKFLMSYLISHFKMIKIFIHVDIICIIIILNSSNYFIYTQGGAEQFLAWTTFQNVTKYTNIFFRKTSCSDWELFSTSLILVNILGHICEENFCNLEF